MPEEKIGKVSHFFDKVSVAAIVLEGDLKVGDKIHIKGATTDFTTQVDSMQINREDVETAKSGDEIGIKVPEKCRGNDEIFKVSEE
ncbi:MAG: translation elongation factor-like protein [Nanoarchaeota archaeon]|nr:translation elongation factor-like protein [Nanoarchaeota archaeon]